MWRFIFSLALLIGLNGIGMAQEEQPKILRIGGDLSKIGLRWVMPERTELDFSLDLNMNPKIFAVFEAGHGSVKAEEHSYDYQSQGIFARIGINYNFLKNEESSYPKENIQIGLRYAWSTYQHEASQQFPTSYWEENVGISKERRNTHWLEGIVQAYAPLSSSIYFGWTVRLKARMAQNEGALEAYWIPGYGRGVSNLTTGFNYSVFYLFPLTK